MKKFFNLLEQHQKKLSFVLLAGILLLYPFLVAFTYHPLGQFFVPSSLIIRVLAKVGEWTLNNLGIVVDIGKGIVQIFTPDCPPGNVIFDKNSPLNGFSSGCLECTIGEIHKKLPHPLMVRSSIDASWDLAPSYQNICR